MSLSFSKKTKCQGCAALCLVNKSTSYECSLGYQLDYVLDTSGFPIKPKPEEKCYKPKTQEELKQAKKLMKEASAAK